MNFIFVYFSISNYKIIKKLKTYKNNYKLLSYFFKFKILISIHFYVFIVRIKYKIMDKIFGSDAKLEFKIKNSSRL